MDRYNGAASQPSPLRGIYCLQNSPPITYRRQWQGGASRVSRKNALSTHPLYMASALSTYGASPQRPFALGDPTYDFLSQQPITSKAKVNVQPLATAIAQADPMSLEVKVCSGIDVPNAAEPEAIDRCPAAIEQCAETPIILSTSVVPDCSCDDDHQTIEIDEEGDEDEDRAAREGETEQCSQEEPEIDACIKGLIHYKKWWYFREVDIAVDGEMLTGIPAFLHENTLRVINDAYSYFIPMRNIRYIRTPDGLRSSRSEFEDSRS